MLDARWLEDDAAPRGAADAAPPGSLEALERDAIRRALAASGGNRRLAAEQLGMGLRTLYEKLKRFDLG